MLQDVETRISDAISAAERPIEAARGLPASWYWDPSIFELERERIFRRTWMAVCFTDEVPNKGDVYPTRVAGTEVVVVRAANGKINVFHNICRHRAARVVTEPAKSQKVLRCSYHCWTYGLDGALRNAPYFEGEASCRPNGSHQTSLVPVRSDEWQGIVFVNLDGQAQSLQDYVKPLADRWSCYETANLPVYKIAERSIPANWKIVMEGLLEVYHEHFIHKNLTYRLGPDGEKTWEDILDGEMMGFRSVMPEENQDHPLMTLPRLPGMPAKGVAPTEIFLLFPSVSLNILDNHFVRTIWTFGSNKETSWKSTWHFAPGADDSDEGRTNCEGVVDFWCDVRAEDLDAVLAVQAGMESRTGFPVETCYSPFWEPILQHFHLRVARGLKTDWRP